VHSVDLIAKAIAAEAEALPYAATEGVCCVTGQMTSCLPRRHLLGKSFTNLDLLAAPGSDMASVAAYRALTYKWERMSSWYCDGVTFRKLTRQEVRTLVLGAQYGACWAGYATTSYKKHGALRAPVNSGSKRVWLFETLLVDCSDHARLLAVWGRLNDELRAGLPRATLETLEVGGYNLMQVGCARWLAFDWWARPLYQGPLYRFLCYLLPSMSELKQENERGASGMETTSIVP